MSGEAEVRKVQRTVAPRARGERAEDGLMDGGVHSREARHIPAACASIAEAT